MGKRVLVVSTVEHPENLLRSELDESDTVRVIVPIVRQSLLDWLANDQKAFTRAAETAERIADELPGETVAPAAGEDDVGLAIRDALATFPADEIVVAVHPSDQAGLIESKATDTAPTGSLDGIPVRYVVIAE